MAAIFGSVQFSNSFPYHINNIINTLLYDIGIMSNISNSYKNKLCHKFKFKYVFKLSEIAAIR